MGTTTTRTSKPTDRHTAARDGAEGFTAEERAAMKDRATEVRTARRGSKVKPDPEEEVLARIAEMPDSDRVMAERVHAIVREVAPSLTPRTWYGMPAYARDGKVVCFFQSAAKFKARYATLGFNDVARLDDGSMWPTAYALTGLTPADEEVVAALVRKAAN